MQQLQRNRSRHRQLRIIRSGGSGHCKTNARTDTMSARENGMLYGRYKSGRRLLVEV
jgi:hypothetical protein